MGTSKSKPATSSSSALPVNGSALTCPARPGSGVNCRMVPFQYRARGTFCQQIRRWREEGRRFVLLHRPVALGGMQGWKQKLAEWYVQENMLHTGILDTATCLVYHFQGHDSATATFTCSTFSAFHLNLEVFWESHEMGSFRYIDACGVLQERRLVPNRLPHANFVWARICYLLQCGAGVYNIITNNCQSAAYWVYYGKFVDAQAERMCRRAGMLGHWAGCP